MPRRLSHAERPPGIDAAHEAVRAARSRTAEGALLRIFEMVVDRSPDKLERTD